MVEKIWALESCQLGEHLDFSATRSRHIWLKHFSKRQTSYTQWFVVIFEFSLWSNRFGHTIYFRRMYNKRKQCLEWINTRKAKNWMVLLERQSQEIRGNQSRTKFQAKGFFKNHSVYHFSDASEIGYGQASYLWLFNEDDQIHCN